MGGFRARTSATTLLLRETGLARRLYALRARRGYFGDEVDWSAEYAAGKWQFFNDLDQACHYEAIAEAIALYQAKPKPHGSVLDVGCGEGILHRTLRLAPTVCYVGIDPSATAVAKAAAAATGDARFQVATAEDYTPDRRFDVIVFNEVLYYCDDPVATMRKDASYLSAGGIFIVSMALCGLRDGLTKLTVWDRIERGATMTTEIALIAPTAGWIVKVLIPTPANAPIAGVPQGRALVPA